ncbi:hypothetical protein QTO34_007811 [Cnephaeus nilssonii]|uniref:Uncharacterized protein n=1 Tax=Cnephaeus nilssonii TaxID=3371016 RepID=A0AA40HIZ9_CNENI|nr:hypothetical protein QTO34_007811 [Eptesicus nilssonii]
MAGERSSCGGSLSHHQLDIPQGLPDCERMQARLRNHPPPSNFVYRASKTGKEAGVEKRQLQGHAPGKQDSNLGHQIPFCYRSPPKVWAKPQQRVTDAGTLAKKRPRGKKTSSKLLFSLSSLHWHGASAFQLFFKAYSSEECELSPQLRAHRRPRL